MPDRFNLTRTVLASAARTATVNSDAQVNRSHRGLHLVVYVSAVTDTPSITPKVQGYDPVEDDWYDILVGAAITSTGTTVLKVYPGIAASANESANDVLPGKWRTRVEHLDADSITYAVTALLVV